MGRSDRILSGGLVVLAAAFLVAGRWDLALAVGVGAVLGWVLLDPVRITWAVFLVAFAIPVTIDFGYPTNPSYTLLLLLFVLAGWGRLHRAERDGWRRSVILAALVLPLCGLVSGLVHWHGAKPIVVGLSPLLCVGVLCWHVVEEARRDRRLVIRIAEWLTWFSVPVAAFAKYQTLSRSWPIFDQLAYHWTYTSAFDATRAVGISGHPIIYGTFAMTMALVALTIRGRFWYVPLTANLMGLVLSGTRSAWVGIALALTLWLLLRWRTISWRGVGSAILIAATAFLLVVVTPPVPTISTTAAPGPVWFPPAPTTPTSVPSPAASAPSPATSAPSPANSAPSPATSAPSPATSAPSPATSAPGSADPAPSPATSTPGTADPVGGAESRLSDPLQSASANARFARISVVWDGITRNWSTVVFGNGPESNVRYLETVGIGDGEAQVFDNSYLTFWYNYGLLGLACLLSLLAILWWRCRSVTARVLLVALAAQVFFFDVWLWLGAVIGFVLAVALNGDDRTPSTGTPGFVPGSRGPERDRAPTG
ncbi:O-antigen ligase family protein [Micromonospora sp. STR1_7]|uniref:O-antigen ligase family protein n=1 Tax=Micromonospora parastrephiae TaxID=2806101 RepID=A0ABS1XW23_9ACTN|nr:O-antigen ligase family protein [Micromonospora parastrephiae]MBM0233449.1 O-antigen ligase family protein [Micromonospora parastrephiae]